MTPPIKECPTRPAVVIVGDDRGFVGMLRQRIRRAGCRPICARDAREALAAITHEKPALVVIVFGAPEVHGPDLLAKLDRSPALASIPRLLLSPEVALQSLESIQWPVPSTVSAVPLSLGR